jgi:plastocyanin
MTLGSPTFSDLRLLVLGLLAAHLAAATVKGRVELADSRDPGVRSRKDYSGVAVWLENADGSTPPLRPVTARMLQRKKTFTPHLLAVPVGSTVEFPNLDPIFHNAFSNFAGQPFDVGLYPPGKTEKVHFRREGVARVFCNIHPTMSAVIVVVKTPWLAVSQKDGSFSIENVPPGEYRVRVFHERATQQTLDRLERKITAADAGANLGVLAISESGFIQVPHKNKFGKDYPPVIEDRPAYLGRKP